MAQKSGNFWKPQQKFKKSKKKIYWQKLSRILQSMQHTQGDTKERELLKCVVAVKECIRGGGRHLQDEFSNIGNLDYCLLKGKL